MPPMSEVAADSGVAVGTVQRAYALLVEEGLIRTVKGRGTFVVGQ
jgi:DNA-binding GntR family transcriptional regulator